MKRITGSFAESQTRFLGTAKRGEGFPYTYRQRLSKNDERSVIEEEGTEMFYQKKLGYKSLMYLSFLIDVMEEFLFFCVAPWMGTNCIN